MSSGVTPTFVLIGVALIIWSAAASLSTYLAADFEREHKGKAEQTTEAGHSATELPSSQDVEELRKAATDNPQDAEAQVQLGYALIKEAREQSKAEFLMEAVQVFNKALQVKSEHPGALLGLAALSLQSGVIEKALEFYPRYLKVAPNDARARSDYSLALFQAGRSEESEQELQGIIKKDPSFLPALMTLAYKRKQEGKVSEALTLAKRARESASNDALRQNIDGFIASLSETASENPAKAPSPDRSSPERSSPDRSSPDRSSPAVRLQKYFNEHNIIGPKLESIRWESPTIAVVAVRDFPVEQMPPFAKAQFLKRMQQNFADIAEQITIQLRDAQNGKELLSVQVGKKPNPSSK